MSNVSISGGYGSLTTFCISGTLPVGDICKPLYVANALDTAPAVPGEYYAIYSVDQARTQFGAGSIAALMAREHFAACPSIPLYVAPVKADGAATAAEWTLTITGTATAAGVISFAVADMLVQVPVTIGTTATTAGVAVASAINALNDMPVTAAHNAGVVTLTAKNKGESGNWFAPVFNPNVGDEMPPGLTLALASTVTGSGLTDVSLAMSVFACIWDCIALGFEDQAAVDTVVMQVRSQWGCPKQDMRFGHVFYPHTDSDAGIIAYGNSRNYEVEAVTPAPVDYKYPGHMIAAAAASRFCCSACTDPSRPVQYDNGILGDLYDNAQCSSIWPTEVKRAFRDAGILIWDVASNVGAFNVSLVIEEPLTTYKTNPQTGARDLQWERVEYRYIAAKFVRDLNRWYRTNYASVSLVSDGTRIPQGKRAVTPRQLEAAIKSWMRSTQLGFTFEGPDALEGVVTVTRPLSPNNCDPNRVDVAINFDFVNVLARIVTDINASPAFACLPNAA